MSSPPTLFLHLGNKEKLAPDIVPRLQAQLDESIHTYCEPMFGGGRLCLAFLATQPNIKKLVLNDRDIGTASLWTSILRHKDELIQRVYEFKPTVEAFDRLSEFLKVRKISGGHKGVIDIGFATLALHRLSHDGRGTLTGGARGGKNQDALKGVASRWQPKKLSGYIQQLRDTLTAYEIEGNACSAFDFQRVLESSNERMLAFIDPPYYSTGQNLYHIGFSEEDHYRLSQCLKETHHTFVLNYDDHPTVRSLYDWAEIETITAKYGRWSPKQSPEVLIFPKQAAVWAAKSRYKQRTVSPPSTSRQQDHQFSPPSLFQHPGNKGKLKVHILPRLQDQLKNSTIETYCEPFLGSASLCLAFLSTNPPIQKLVLNDRDIGVASLWTSVIRHPEDLIQRVREFQPTVEAFHRLKEFLKIRKVSGGHESIVDIGFANLAIHQISYGGRGTMAAGALGGWAQMAQEKVDSRWKPERLEEKIRQCHQILTSYKIERNECSAFDFMRVQESSSERMLAYIDPPYYENGKQLYHLNFDVDDHHRLAQHLRHTEHAWALSYDDHPVIHKLYDWAEISPLTVDYRSRSPKKSQEILIYPKQGMVTILKPKSRKKSKEESQEVPQVKTAANHDASPQCQRLNIADIRLDEELHARVDMRQDVILDYAERMLAGAHFPPVTVFFDGSTYWLADGWHRIAAAIHNEMTEIEAQVQEGTCDEALLYAVGSNATHGLRRTNADKRRAVTMLLTHPEFREWSDRELARRALVSHDFVNRIRWSLSFNDSENSRRKYHDRHGNSSTMNTSNIGGRNRQRPQYTFQTAQVFDHVRQLIRSYELAFPGLEVEYQKKHNTVTIRVKKGKKTATQTAADNVYEPLEAFLNQVINGNCREVLPTIPSNSIPIVITDIPIFDDFYFDESLDESSYLDYLDWLREAFTELYRIGTSDARYCLNIQGTNGSSSFSYSDILQLARQVGFQYRSEVTWYTPIFQRSALNNMGSVNAPNLTNPVERIAILYKHSWEKQRKGKSDSLGSDHMRLVQGFWEIDPDEQQDTSLHLARLPLEIPLNLLKLLSFQDDLVLDPFGSGGTVAVAAQQLGRPFISIESSEQHWEIAKERLERAA